VSLGRTLRAAVAGAVAAGAWAAVEPAIQRVTGGRHTQVRLIGGVVAPDGPWLWFARRSPAKPIDPGRLPGQLAAFLPPETGAP